MSVMSTGEESRDAGISADFIVPLRLPRLRPASSASCDTAGRTADASGPHDRRADERGERDLRVTYLHFRELQIREVRAGGHSARQYRTGAMRTAPSPEVRASEARAGQARASEARASEISARQSRPRELRVSAPASRAAGARAAGARAPADARPAPVRLTRRGRLVVAALVVLTATATAIALWLSMAGGAQAASHGQSARAGYQGMTEVVVQPGQTLWSMAASAEPSANPWIVIQQIIDANALGGTAIHAGELLWVPKG